MATATAGNVPARDERRSDEFKVVGSDRSLGRNLPQRMAGRLWAPMLALALVGFAAGLITAIVRADTASTSPGDIETLARLHHLGAGFMFLGFAGVFSAIVFAIARILGTFRDGGGTIQESVTGHVQTLKMPVTARGMMAFMAMGMMAIVVPVVLHFVAAGSVVGPTEADALRSEQWFVVLEGFRRLGVALYLVGITLGLATIIHVLRFQSIRVREIADEHDAHSTA